MSQSTSTTPSDTALIATTDPVQMQGLFYTVAELREQMSPIGYMTPADQLNAAAVAVAQATANAAIPISTLGQPLGPVQSDATNKVPIANLPSAVLGSSHYLGVWNAATNTPLIVSSTPPDVTAPVGGYYIVSVAGTPTIDGISVWNAGDWIIWNGTTWNNISGQVNPVSSVAGLQGAVTTTQLASALAGTVALSTTGGQLNVILGTSSNSAAAGNDSRIVGALQGSKNLEDVESISTARSNLGLTPVAISSFNAAGGPPQLDSSGEISGQTIAFNASAMATVAELLVYAPNALTDGVLAWLPCYAITGDQGGGLVVYEASSTAVHDFGTVFCPSSKLVSKSGNVAAATGASTLSFTIPNTPIHPGTLSISAGSYSFTDNGTGVLSATGASGAINFATGVGTLNFFAPVAGSLATGDSATTTFSGSLGVALIPGSLSLTCGIVVGSDNGSGSITGSGISAGAINYTTGAWSVSFAAAPTTGAELNMAYDSTAGIPASGAAIAATWQYAGTAGRWIRQFSGLPDAAFFNVNPSNSATMNDLNLARAFYAISGPIQLKGLYYNFTSITINQNNRLVGAGNQQTTLNCQNTNQGASFVTIAHFAARPAGLSPASRLVDCPLSNVLLTTSRPTVQGLIGLSINVNNTDINYVTIFGSSLVNGFAVNVQFGTSNVYQVVLNSCCIGNAPIGVMFPQIFLDSGELVKFHNTRIFNNNIGIYLDDRGLNQWHICVDGGSLDYNQAQFDVQGTPSEPLSVVVNCAHIEFNATENFVISTSNSGYGCITCIGCDINVEAQYFISQSSGAAFTAAIDSTGNNLTISGLPSKFVGLVAHSDSSAASTILGNGFTDGAYLVSQTSGTSGGNGVYTLNTTQKTLKNLSGLSANAYTPASAQTATCTFYGSITAGSSTLTVLNVSVGGTADIAFPLLTIGSFVTGAGIVSNSTIIGLGSGNGGSGTYTLSNPANISQTNAAMVGYAAINAIYVKFIGCTPTTGVLSTYNMYDRTITGAPNYPQTFIPTLNVPNASSPSSYANFSPTSYKVRLPVTYNAASGAATFYVQFSQGAGDYYEETNLPAVTFPAGMPNGIVQVYEFDAYPGGTWSPFGTNVTLGQISFVLV